MIEANDQYLAPVSATSAALDLTAAGSAPSVDAFGSEACGEREQPVNPNRDAVYRRTLACADVVAAAVATFGVWKTIGSGHSMVVLLAAPGIVPLSKLTGIYDRGGVVVRKATLDEAPSLFQLATLYTLTILVIGGAGVMAAGDRRGLVLWPALFALLVLFRATGRRLARAFTPSERCLVVGDARQCQWMQVGLVRERALHAKVVARVSPTEMSTDPSESAVSANTDLVRQAAARFGVDRIIVVPGSADEDRVLSIIDAAASLGVKVSIVPKALRLVGASAEFDDVDGVPVLSAGPRGLSRPSRALKRGFDIAGSGIGLVILAPFLGSIAAMIKLDSRGPVFFRQRRIGRDGASFEMLKFRTMVVDAEARKHALSHLNQRDGLFKIVDDPRVTRIGGWLRRTAIDELPQLLNVLRGEMSLVGPRPLVDEEDKRIEGWRRRRLQLTPGMTGSWQIKGSTRVSLDELGEIDYLYVTSWSLWLDLKILLRTIPFVLNRRGL